MLKEEDEGRMCYLKNKRKKCFYNFIYDFYVVIKAGSHYYECE